MTLLVESCEKHAFEPGQVSVLQHCAINIKGYDEVKTSLRVISSISVSLAQASYWMGTDVYTKNEGDRCIASWPCLKVYALKARVKGKV